MLAFPFVYPKIDNDFSNLTVILLIFVGILAHLFENSNGCSSYFGIGPVRNDRWGRSTGNNVYPDRTLEEA